MAYDLIIRGGLIVDGTGSEPYLGDVASTRTLLLPSAKLKAPAQEKSTLKDTLSRPGLLTYILT